MVNVVDGAADANYTLPAGTPVGTYTIKAAYDGTAHYTGFIDSAHQLTVTAATAVATSIAASNTSVAFSASSQAVTLNASVTSAAGMVNAGTVTFTLLSGTTVVGTSVTAPVVAGRQRQLHVARRLDGRPLYHPGDV